MSYFSAELMPLSWLCMRRTHRPTELGEVPNSACRRCNTSVRIRIRSRATLRAAVARCTLHSSANASMERRST